LRVNIYENKNNVCGKYIPGSAAVLGPVMSSAATVVDPAGQQLF
jgi:hypothetical protein